MGPEAEEAKLKANAAQDRSDLENQLQELRKELKQQQAQEAQQQKARPFMPLSHTAMDRLI